MDNFKVKWCLCVELTFSNPKIRGMVRELRACGFSGLSLNVVGTYAKCSCLSLANRIGGAYTADSYMLSWCAPNATQSLGCFHCFCKVVLQVEAMLIILRSDS